MDEAERDLAQAQPDRDSDARVEALEQGISFARTGGSTAAPDAIFERTRATWVIADDKTSRLTPNQDPPMRA